ncbi:MAG: hypothetical protein KDE35_11735 [Geminicoccaceae bacterium]|nr:hypothetical protein [Geminicoccaceae bacterium]
MTSIWEFFALAALVAGFLATVAIWSPKRMPIKLSAVTASILFLPLTWAAMSELLSKPKPVDLEWWAEETEEATVLGSTMREEKGIFLWLQLDQLDEPRSYVLPWSRQLAQQLQEALDEAAESETAVRMRLPFESSLDDREPRFYAMPQPAMPPKDRHDDDPLYFGRET